MTITQGRLYRAILAVLLFAFGLAVWLVRQEGFDVGFFIGFSILGSFAVFSIWLTHKRPDNNVSWLLLTVTTTTMVS